jgi:hypothetical protein
MLMSYEDSSSEHESSEDSEDQSDSYDSSSSSSNYDDFEKNNREHFFNANSFFGLKNLTCLDLSRQHKYYSLVKILLII